MDKEQFEQWFNEMWEKKQSENVFAETCRIHAMIEVMDAQYDYVSELLRVGALNRLGVH